MTGVHQIEYSWVWYILSFVDEKKTHARLVFKKIKKPACYIFEFLRMPMSFEQESELLLRNKLIAVTYAAIKYYFHRLFMTFYKITKCVI